MTLKSKIGNWLLLVAVAVLVLALIFSGNGDKSLEKEVIELKKTVQLQKDSIRARDLFIDSLRQEQIKADGVIVALDKGIKKSRQQLKEEQQRLDNITSHELQEEIIDYYTEPR